MVSNVSNLPLLDLYPPSQITDLEATPDGDLIHLTWTAPGDNFDVGKGEDEGSCGFDEVKDAHVKSRVKGWVGGEQLLIDNSVKY